MLTSHALLSLLAHVFGFFRSYSFRRLLHVRRVRYRAGADTRGRVGRGGRAGGRVPRQDGGQGER